MLSLSTGMFHKERSEWLEQIMTFISYAQNHEDVILSRAFVGKSNGFYIDIGACFPDDGSVTKHFYDLGWRGVNVEPHPEAFKLLANQRIKDINLNIAIAESDGEVRLYYGKSIGETTALKGEDSTSFITPALSLKSICEKYVHTEIDFLKVDVEGYEYNVLRGGDWEHFRPKIIVCEVTYPWSNQIRPDGEKINLLLSKQGYQMVYFDGINRYFVAQEASALRKSVSFQPNVIDNFVSSTEHDLLTQISNAQKIEHELEFRLQTIQADRERLQTQLDEVRVDHKQIRKQLDEVWAGREQIRKQLDEVRVDWEQIRKQLDEVRVDREQIRKQLDEVRVDREQIRKQLDEVRVDREQIQKQLDEVWADREQIQKQLDEVWVDRERIRKQLDEVWVDRERMYHSRSWKITAPMRYVLGVILTWRNKVVYLKNKLVSYLVPAFKEIVKSVFRRFVVVTAGILSFVVPRLYVRLVGNEKLRRVHSRILRPKMPISDVSISQQINNISPIVLETDFRRNLQLAVHEWRLGERVDD